MITDDSGRSTISNALADNACSYTTLIIPYTKKSKGGVKEGEERRIKESDGRRLQGIKKKKKTKGVRKEVERSRCCVLEREMKV